MAKRNIFREGTGQEFADLPVGQITLIRFNKFGALRMNPACVRRRRPKAEVNLAAVRGVLSA